MLEVSENIRSSSEETADESMADQRAAWCVAAEACETLRTVLRAPQFVPPQSSVTIPIDRLARTVAHCLYLME